MLGILATNRQTDKRKGVNGLKIGSCRHRVGICGAITACRLARKWRDKVMVIERGKRYPMGSFPRSPHDLGRNFWVMPDENRPRAKQIQRLAKKGRGERGMFDIRNYRHMDVVVGAGLGGGSLIYANVFLEPPTEIFDKRWPTTAKKDQLQYYYGVAKEVLGARPIPTWKNDQDRRFIQRTKTFQDAAREMKRDSELLDLMVFFGNDFDDPAPIGHQSLNRHGALQTSCVYCAECDIASRRLQALAGWPPLWLDHLRNP
mgnify:CR=1 FL=1|jgi:cholesterol oxidase